MVLALRDCHSSNLKDATTRIATDFVFRLFNRKKKLYTTESWSSTSSPKLKESELNRTNVILNRLQVLRYSVMESTTT